jgi:hypothetical protein
LSSRAKPHVPAFAALAVLALAAWGGPVRAADDSLATVTPPAASDAAGDGASAGDGAPPPPPEAEAEPRPRINLMVTVPRAAASAAQQQECVDRAEAGRISGEIVVCGSTGSEGKAPLTGDRAASQRRYAQETALKGAPRAPDLFGIPDNGKGISLGGVPPPVLYIDVEALPPAPAGSDADRIARGLPPLGEDGELSEEEERARREAAGIKTVVPPRSGRKRN